MRVGVTPITRTAAGRLYLAAVRLAAVKLFGRLRSEASGSLVRCDPYCSKSVCPTDGTPFAPMMNSMYGPGGASLPAAGGVTVRLNPSAALVKLNVFRRCPASNACVVDASRMMVTFREDERSRREVLALMGY